ncbi:MAG: PepSY domain-containing protein [Rhizobiales bacterium]|nr:PepSY domain-containing protein [Hyphomicrobiales bacterium]
MKRLLTVVLLAAFPQAADATGLYTCESVAQEKWLTEEQLTKQLTDAGWREVRRMKPDGGCWEVYGTTPDGLRVEGYFHPATGEQLMLNQRGKIIFQKQ